MKRQSSWALAGLLLIFSGSVWAAIPGQAPRTAQKPRWLLKPFLKMAAEQPERLLRLADKLFDDDRLRITTIEPEYAFDWQHRLAMVQSLSDFFDPESRTTGLQRKHARELISKAMTHDPALLVRDGAVESVRRVLRMQPGEARVWRKPLEETFLNKNNQIQGEGLFIRETVLTALHEGGLRPSARVLRVAHRDQNLEVRALAQNWRSQAYDEIGR